MKKSLFTLLLLSCHTLQAGEADVTNVKVTQQPNGTYQFHVTVSHHDDGWEHYANKWDIIGPDGTIYGTRTLYHPHVNEQPFTRSLSGITIPNDVEQVTIRAHDLIHEYGGKTMTTKIK